MTSDNPLAGIREPAESTSDNTTPTLGPRRRGRAPATLPVNLETVLAAYAAKLARATMLDDDTRRAYTSRVRGYLAWLAAADVDGDPLTDPTGRDGAVRDYRAHLQTVAKRSPATINTVLAALADFYHRSGLGTPTSGGLSCPSGRPAR